jgi:hypothetical protein
LPFPRPLKISRNAIRKLPMCGIKRRC